MAIAKIAIFAMAYINFKMKKRLAILFILILPQMVYGQQIEKNEIISCAGTIMHTNNISIATQSESYCVVKNDEGKGFVVLSLKKKSRNKVIAYSRDGIWTETQLPPLVMDWIMRLNNTSENVIQKTRTAQNRPSIKTLLTCHWHQNSPYNDLAPVITDGNVKTVAGCVAIAAAQIAYYWRKDNPESTLKDTPVYPYGAAPVTMSIPKGSPNNWELIKDVYDKDDSPESKYAVAQLCYVLGTTSYLNYASSTGGSINDAANALYGQYNLLSTYTVKKKYTQQEWDSLIYQEIAKGRPVLCAGSDNGGHAFVLDGYDGENDLYHFNFGWGGSGDGYYPIDDSEISMGGYYKNQAIVYNIHPKDRNINAILTSHRSSSGLIDITINITNKGTLALPCLKLYVLSGNETLSDKANLVWQYDEIIECDSIEKKIEVSNISCPEEIEITFYLTDENDYVISELHQQIDSGIHPAQNTDKPLYDMIYDLHGNKVDFPDKGVYIIRKNGKTIKIIK